MLTFYFSGAEGCMTVPELLTAGMVGKELRLEFSPEWEALRKTVVFSNGEIVLDRLYTGETMVIPAQVLERPLEQLTVGLYGISADGTVVIPTIRAMGPVILPSVAPTGDPGMDPSMSAWDQLLNLVGQPEKLETDEKGSLVGAINELVRTIGQNRAASYYDSLAAAIADLNNGVTANALEEPENARVAAFTSHRGTGTLMLLADADESTNLTVTRDMDLVLAGRKLNLTTASAVLNFAAGTKCRIFGEIPGSAIRMEGITAASNVAMITTNGDLFEIHGGTYTMNIQNSARASGIVAGANCKKYLIDGVSASVTNTGAGQARLLQSQATQSTVIQNTEGVVNGQGIGYGLYLGADTELRNCKLALRAAKDAYGVMTNGNLTFRAEDFEIRSVSDGAHAYCVNVVSNASAHLRNVRLIADASGCHATDPSYAIAVSTKEGSKVYIDRCYAFGTHSAISNGGSLYINGGDYIGFCHGGVYCAGPDTYVNDATLRCGNYEGEFDYSGKTAEIYGSMYIGGGAGNDNLTAYLDGCTITNEGGNPIVMRGTSGEKNNSVYISNSTVLGTIRIDNDNLKLMVGIGTNITNEKIDNPGRAAFTGELYRRNPAEKVLNGLDYAALTDFVMDTAGLVKSVGGVAPDKNGNVPLEWMPGKIFKPGVVLQETTLAGGMVYDLTYEMLEGQEEVAVLCDGRLYLCSPEFGYEAGDGYFVKLGNKSILDATTENTGEPFCFWGYRGNGFLLANFAVSGNHTVSISGYVYEYNKLPAQYLPTDAIREIVEAVLAEKA